MTDPEIPDPDLALLNLEFIHTQRMEGIRTEADALATAAYAAHPVQADAAGRMAAYFAEGTCLSYGEDYDGHPAGPTLLSAFKKLVFAFTDPGDPDWSLSDRPVMDMLGGLMYAVADRTGELMELATVVDRTAAHMFLLRQWVGDEELRGMSPDESFYHVEHILETIIESRMREDSSGAIDREDT